ncbi:MAG: MarC family protein [FCB group bacterium]|jgi:multiple antibiotic resistance protein|nr:MarC family protein [FCB group bacterium]
MDLHTWTSEFLKAWIPLFVALDPPGAAPLFLGLTQGLEPAERRRVANQATVTAALVAVGFLFLGELTLRALGITLADFQVAGGLILLGLAYRDLLTSVDATPVRHVDVGVVPLGTPLIAGPATLTILLVSVKSVGTVLTLLALATNLLLVLLAFRYSDRLTYYVGLRGLNAVAKIIALLLAAIAVHMIRQGWPVV